MLLLATEAYAKLLRLLFSLDSKSFAAIQTAFLTAFPGTEERLKACCAALLLLEDSRALNTAQRLGTWFLVYVGWSATDARAGSSGLGPVAEYLVAVAGDERRSAVERKLVQQLLQPQKVKQLQQECCNPLDYALSYSLPLVSQPDSSNASANAELAALQEQLMPGLSAASTSELDKLLHDKKQQLVMLVSSIDSGRSSSTPMLSIAPASHTGPTSSSGTSYGMANGHVPRRSSPGSVALSDASSAPNTPSVGLGTILAPSPLRPGPAELANMSSRVSISGPLSSLSNNTQSGRDSSGAPGSDLQGHTTPQHIGPANPVPEAVLVQVRELVDRALVGPLMPAQQSVVLAAVAEHPGVLSACGIGPSHLPALVEHTPGIAVELLLRLGSAPQLLADYLAVLAHSEMSLHGMEVVNRLTTSMELPTEFLHLYITNCIHTCEATQDKYVQSRHVRLLCVFLQSLIRNRIINIADLLHEVQSFCVNFSRIREAAKLFRLLKQIEAGARNGSDGAGSPTAANAGNGLDIMDALNGEASLEAMS